MKHYFISLFLILAYTSYASALHIPALQLASDDNLQKVKIGLMVLDIHKIDNVDEYIRGEFVLFMQYMDTSLCIPGQKGMIGIPFEEANPPQIQVKNLQEIEDFNRRTLWVAEDGTVTYRHRFLGDVHQQFNFRNFPFDTQNWTITLISAGEEVFQIIADDAYQGLMSADSITLTSWQINYKGQSTKLSSNFGFPIYALEIQYSLQRNPEFYIWKVVIPIILVVFMSWSVFWINPSNISAQLTVSVTAILTLIAFQFSVSQLMPPLPYLTKLDLFTVGADIFVFIAFVETIVTSYLENKGRLKTSESIDYYARFVFPIAFIIFIFITFM